MTVTLGAGAFNFGNPSHGTLEELPWDQPVAVQGFFGIRGEMHLVGQNQGRDLSLQIMIYNGANEAVLRTATNTIGAAQGLSGTLTIDGLSWPNVRFVGFTPSERPFLDGSGQLGWCVRGTLKFRQITS
jgi:hypothetical protein